MLARAGVCGVGAAVVTDVMNTVRFGRDLHTKFARPVHA
jgi:hypothetical protein